MKQSMIRCLYKQHLNSHPKSWMLSLLVGIAMLFSTQAKAQIWGTTQTFALQYYDIPSNTWSVVSNIPNTSGFNTIKHIAYHNGNIYAVRGESFGGGTMYSYNIATNTWVSMMYSSYFSNFVTPTDNNTMFLSNGTGLFKYNLSASTVTAVNPTLTGGLVINAASSINTPTFDGTGNLYFTMSQNNASALQKTYIVKYNISTNVISPILEISNSVSPAPLVYLDNALYYTNSTPLQLKKLDLTTNTEATIQPVSIIGQGYMVAVGKDIYRFTNASATLKQFMKYDFTTNTWVQLLTGTTWYSFAWDGTGVAPTATASAVAATCTGTTTNSNAQLVLTAFTGATKVGYSIGSTYTGPDFASATTLTAAPFTVVNNLPNPTVNQPYTIRAFVSATSYIDRTVLISPTNCTSADLSLTVATATQTGNKGETLTYTFTLTNNGPNDVSDAMANINIPSNVTLLNASPSQGTYTENTKLWNVGAVANGGSKTLVISVKVN